MTLRSPIAALCAGLLLSISLGTQAQPSAEPEWQEGDIPAPPAFALADLVPFVASVNSELRFGVAPGSLSVGADGVVRYVVVARSPTGALNVAFEGLRCKTGEMKTYARWNASDVAAKAASSADGSWKQASQPAWRDLSAPGARPALALARQAFCDGPTPNGTPAHMLRTLKTGGNLRSG
jgi:hypothetical protein